MGCTSSKLDDLPAVLLCRERCSFLDEAIRQRFAFAEAHLAYTHSLKQIGQSLHRFIDQATSNSGGGGGGVTLNLPPHKKVDQDEKITTREIKGGGGGGGGHHSHSNSGSHLHFHTDSDDSGSISLHHSGHSSPLHNTDLQYENNYINGSSSSPYPQSYPPPSSGYPQSYPPPSSGYPQSYPPPSSGYMQMNFMRNKTTPSVVYQQQPISPDTVHHINESSSLASSSSYYPYPNQYPYSNPYPDYGGGGGGGGGGLSMSNYYGSSSSSQPQQPAQASTSKPEPPPPPSPPRASAWDFLNPFESYDKYYPQYTPSRDLKEVREAEGIPDLEDEDYYYQHEVVKEVDSGNKKKHLKLEENGENGEVGHDKVNEGEAGAAAMYQARQSGVSVENDGMEYEVHVVEKKAVDKERGEENGNGNGAAAFKAGSRDVSDVATEIEDQFVRAAESGNEIAPILEVGKLQYQRKHVSKMLHVVTPSLSMVSSQPSTSKSAEPSSSTDKAGLPHLDIIDEDLSMRMKNLSSTMHKLYLWEKKLYNEVKAEEKMRVLHDRKCRRLKHLDERGAESHKVDATRTLIRSLSTKIRIAINVVDKISVTINKIRDEELWPQLNELIQGLTRMWKSMLECHHSQCLAIKEARGLGPIGSGRKPSDAHLAATLQLEQELLNWTFRFSSWIGAQKGYVRALNGWLLKCLLDEREETADGIAPFSPGRIGAPPVFVICNQWSQALERISEKEVIDSMRIFAMSVLQLWEHDKLAMREWMMANKDLDRKVRNLDREDQKIQKQFQALDKKLVVVSGDGNSLSVPGHIVYQSDTSNISLQGSLQRIFEAMERFTADSMKVYEELLQRSEEERVAQEHERVS